MQRTGKPLLGPLQINRAASITVVAIILICSLFLAGCSLVSLPSQQHPVCSWISDVPNDADAVCGQVFATLRTITRAALHGDGATVRRLVPNRSMEHKILNYGARRRSQKVVGLHVVPDLRINNVDGYIGVGFELVGESRAGKVHDEETVYARFRRGTAVLLHDDPESGW